MPKFVSHQSVCYVGPIEKLKNKYAKVIRINRDGLYSIEFYDVKRDPNSYYFNEGYVLANVHEDDLAAYSAGTDAPSAPATADDENVSGIGAALTAALVIGGLAAIVGSSIKNSK